MTTLKAEAQSYEPKRTPNIADLDKIPLDLELKDGEGKTKDDEVFTYKYAVIAGIEYRVPGPVIGGIKAILEKLPDCKFVSVIKTGTGRDTKYQVIPMDK